MRLATFAVGRGSQTGLCTIIRMGAAAGDLEANTQRWLSQLGLGDPAPGELTAFLARQERVRTAGGWEATVIDFSGWGAPAADAPSMLAGLVAPGDFTLFIKLTGPAALIRSEHGALLELVRSLRPESP